MGRDFSISFSIGTKAFLNLSGGGSGPSRWPPPFRGRVGGGLPLPFAPEASFSVLIPLSFGMRSLYGLCVLVGSHLYPTEGCHWCLALYPSGWASSLCLRLLFPPCSCRRISWWSSLRPRVFESSRLFPVFFPFRGPTPVSRMFLSLRPSRSHSPIPSLAPSWWSPFPLLRRDFLSLSCYVLRVPSAFLCFGLVCRSCSHCRPSRAVSSLTVSVLCAWSLLRLGHLPTRWVPSEPMGFAVAPPISPYTGPGQSPRP